MSNTPVTEYQHAWSMPADSVQQADIAPFFDTSLDPGIVVAVRILRAAGVDTVWSCEGGDGHGYRHPTVIFRGNSEEARRVATIARDARLAPTSVSRVWRLWQTSLDSRGVALAKIGDDFGEWQIEFAAKFPVDGLQTAAHAEWKRCNREVVDREMANRERDRKCLWPQILELEPQIQALHGRICAGVIGANDLWLTYLSCLLEPILGHHRQADGPPMLFTEGAFEAGLTALYYEAAEMYADLSINHPFHSSNVSQTGVSDGGANE